MYPTVYAVISVLHSFDQASLSNFRFLKPLVVSGGDSRRHLECGVKPRSIARTKSSPKESLTGKGMQVKKSVLASVFFARKCVPIVLISF
jgi:hypothetical protein